MSSSDSRIHILGLGSIGSFIAYSLRSLPSPPQVTLLAHRKALYDEFASNEWKIGLRVREDGTLQEKAGFDGELLGESASSEPIHHLIVAVKASATVSALQPLKGRLGPHSTICLCQNGLGQIEELNEQLFVDPFTRPTYLFGIMRHGVYLKSPVEAILSGTNGRATLGLACNDYSASRQLQAQYLLDTLLQSPILQCEHLEWAELLRIQLLKLAANCVMNPLTALLDVQNGVLKDTPDLQPLIRRILEEISMVFDKLPELQAVPCERGSFSATSLEAGMLDTLEKTAENSSSMREDLRKGRKTEIEYINGWVVRRGRELGVNCEANASVISLVLAKSRITSC